MRMRWIGMKCAGEASGLGYGASSRTQGHSCAQLTVSRGAEQMGMRVRVHSAGARVALTHVFTARLPRLWHPHAPRGGSPDPAAEGACSRCAHPRLAVGPGACPCAGLLLLPCIPERRWRSSPLTPCMPCASGPMGFCCVAHQSETGMDRQKA
jgi:hypothetical protein